MGRGDGKGTKTERRGGGGGGEEKRNGSVKEETFVVISNYIFLCLYLSIYPSIYCSSVPVVDRKEIPNILLV